MTRRACYLLKTVDFKTRLTERRLVSYEQVIDAICERVLITPGTVLCVRAQNGAVLPAPESRALYVDAYLHHLNQQRR